MADGKVKKYFKNLRKMVEGEGNIQKTRPTGRGTGKGINIKKPGEGQGGVGVTRQEKPKEEDYLTGIKEHGPLEAKRAGVTNAQKAQTNVVEYHDKPSRAYGEPPTEKMKEAEKQGKRIDKFGHKLDTAHELPRIRGKKDDKNKTPVSPSPVSVYNNKQRGNIAKAVYGHYDDVSKLKEMTDKDIDHLVKKYQVNLKTEKKSKKNKKKRGR